MLKWETQVHGHVSATPLGVRCIPRVGIPREDSQAECCGVEFPGTPLPYGVSTTGFPVSRGGMHSRYEE